MDFGAADSETDGGTIDANTLDRSDARLVKACVSGDAAAWAELVDRYQRLVYSIPRRAGLSEEQCQDVFQDVFLLLFQKIGTIEQPDRVRSWIVTTAKFTTWSVNRGLKHQSSPLNEDEMESEIARLPDRSPLADDVLIELENQHLVRSAVKMLDERCQTIITMLYLSENDASYADVASEIGTGETSISPLRTRCLKKLEKLLR